MAAATKAGLWARLLDSDLYYSFRRNPMVVGSAIVTAIYVSAAFGAPLLAPHDPFNPATLDLMDAFTPPAWMPDGRGLFPIGTDDQGRDLLSAIMYGTRVSLIVGFLSVLFSLLVGVTLGLTAGYVGGWVDAAIMRVGDIQMTFPPILIALLLDGVVRSILGNAEHDRVALIVVVVSIGLSFWVGIARTVRGSVMIERNKEYVQAARVIGLPGHLIAIRHVLPNVTGPVLVIATINLALAIITEATLSFLGVGVPPTQPSLGTLIRIGNAFLLSGEWWITIFPGFVLATLVLAVNLLGDWLRDALNPRLR